ncbi:MAG: hypothetical protein J6L64_02275 [Opitutales bacterium]|nr:hypothetical protein [Opitutales bacterium]
MAKKTSKIIQQKAPPKKEKLSGGAKFGIFVCIIAVAALAFIAVAALAFAAAERLGITGTHFLFKGETVEKSGAAPSSVTVSRTGKTEQGVVREKTAGKTSGEKVADKKTSAVAGKKSENATGSKKSPTSRNKKSSSKKAKAPVQPLPLSAFVDISRKPHTWPGFIRLTRSRTITMSDPQTGASMGRMEVPSGTVVKVFKVLPTGTLEVFDRTGQKFQVEASGTNFSAAYAAVKNKPKKKSKSKKVVAKTSEKTEPKNVPAIVIPPGPDRKKAGGTPVMSAFGVAFDEDEEWEDDADYE